MSIDWLDPQGFPPQPVNSDSDITVPVPRSLAIDVPVQRRSLAMASNLAIAEPAVEQHRFQLVGREDEAMARLYHELARTREEMQALREALDRHTCRGRWWHFGSR